MNLLHRLLERIEVMKGDPGYTPRKGVDYFDGEDGHTPQKGIDYDDGEDGYTPRKNVDYFDGKNGKDGRDGSDAEVDWPRVDAVSQKEVLQHEKKFDHALIHNSKILGDLEYDQVADGQLFLRKGKRIVGIDIPKMTQTIRAHGGGSPTVISVSDVQTANFLATYGSKVWLVDASAGSITATLDSASELANREIVIKKIDSSDNPVIVAGTVDGQADRQLLVQYQCYRIASNGSAFYLT